MLKKICEVKNQNPKLLEKAELDYKFQLELTQELDKKIDDFDELTFLKIVLWKTNRYPILESDFINVINDLRKNYTEQKARSALRHLLNLKGFDLPMASAVLRFACPNELQIIDKRVYRMIMPENKLKIPLSTERKVHVYFEYIEKLKHVALECNIPFHRSDRILYQLDKNVNYQIPIDY